MLSRKQLTDEISDAVAKELRKQYGLRISDAQARKYAGTATKVALAELEAIAEDELSKGQDFTVPGIVRFKWIFSPAKKKGESYKKGDTVSRFGEEVVADRDSPAKAQTVGLRVSATGRAQKVKPGRSKQAKADFLKSPAGKLVVKRLKK